MHLEISSTEASVLRNFLRERLSERLSKETGDMLHGIYLQLNEGREHPTWINRYPKEK
jgi:hypothetical protein